MAWFVFLIIIHCVAIYMYPVDSVTQPLKRKGPTKLKALTELLIN